MASVAVFRISEVIKLNETCPNSSQKLIAPDLINKVDSSASHIVQKFMKNTFFLIDQIFIYSFSCYKDDSEPNQVDNIYNNDGKELSEEIDVSVVEIKPDRSVLNDIAHPLMFDGLTMRRGEEVKVFN